MAGWRYDSKAYLIAFTDDNKVLSRNDKFFRRIDSEDVDLDE